MLVFIVMVFVGLCLYVGLVLRGVMFVFWMALECVLCLYFCIVLSWDCVCILDWFWCDVMFVFWVEFQWWLFLYVWWVWIVGYVCIFGGI